MALDSMQEIFEKMQEGQKPFWKVVQDTDVEERQVSPEASFEKMRMTWKAMLETVDTYRGDLRSLSGLVGGDGQRMAEFAASGKALAGDYLSQVITLALCTAESNACMRKIVAAPTAGACGVLPAVLIPLYRQGVPEEEIVQGLYVAAGIGAVIAYRACIAGASGGCQAEIGSASAMAAGTLTAIPGRQRGADRTCHRYGSEKSDGTCLRSCGGTGGSALCEAERGGRGQRGQLRRYGPGGH